MNRLACTPGVTLPSVSLFSKRFVPALTLGPIAELTNEEIVAELGWTMIVLKNILGVTPNTFRPPFGDIDDRVRAVAKVMGLTAIMWYVFCLRSVTHEFTQPLFQDWI